MEESRKRPKDTQWTAVTISIAQRDALKKIAEDEGSYIRDHVRAAVNDYLESHEKQNATD